MRFETSIRLQDCHEQVLVGALGDGPAFPHVVLVLWLCMRQRAEDRDAIVRAFAPLGVLQSNLGACCVLRSSLHHFPTGAEEQPLVPTAIRQRQRLLLHRHMGIVTRLYTDICN